MRERTTPNPEHAGAAADIRANVVVDAAGCWLWQRYIKPNGYGQFIRTFNGTRYTHRIAYQVWKSAIPDGLDLDHLCRVRRCCNPEHLEAVPHQVNSCRGTSFAATYARTEACPQGHPYDEQNTYLRPRKGGGRDCRRCRSEVTRQCNARIPKQFTGLPPQSRELLFTSERTECRNGHRYEQENIYIDTRGRRHCRECRSAAQQRRTLKLAAITHLR